MKDACDLVDQQQKNLQTQAKKIDSASTLTKSKSGQSTRQTTKHESELWDAVTYMTMLFNEAFPAQFARAWPGYEDRERARGIWVAALKEYSPKRIRSAAQKAIRRASKFMPSLGDIIQLCQFSYKDLGLKQPLQAYYEACNAPSKSADYAWSHPAIYFAAKATGWYFLQTGSQETVFPVFEHNYRIVCQRVQEGEDLVQEITQALENFSKRDIATRVKQANEQDMKHLMQQQGIDPQAGHRAFEDIMKEFG